MTAVALVAAAISTLAALALTAVAGRATRLCAAEVHVRRLAEARLELEQAAHDQAARELFDTAEALADAVREIAALRADNAWLWEALGGLWDASDAWDCPPRERLDGGPF